MGEQEAGEQEAGEQEVGEQEVGEQGEAICALSFPLLSERLSIS